MTARKLTDQIHTIKEKVTLCNRKAAGAKMVLKRKTAKGRSISILHVYIKETVVMPE
jgi:hypothetical protein